MKAKVAVVILNWNGKKLLEEFLPSVFSTLPNYAELWVADNASSDDSLHFLKQHYPQVKLVVNEQNYGFAQGYNEALKSIDAEYYVLLNSDVKTASNWIEPIVELLDANPKVGAAQPKILDYKNPSRFEYAGASGGFIDQLGFPFCRGRIFNDLEEDEGQYNTPLKIFWGTGACLFIRKSLFDSLKGFDEQFFAHMEEIDLCWRIQRSGFDIYCVPDSVVYHLGGGTLKKINPKKTYLNFRNNIAMLIKNSPPKWFWRRLFLKFCLDGMAGIKFLIEGSPKHTLSVLSAHFYIYKNFPRLWKQRRELKKTLGFPRIESIYRESIVSSYYILGKDRFQDLDFN